MKLNCLVTLILLRFSNAYIFSMSSSSSIGKQKIGLESSRRDVLSKVTCTFLGACLASTVSATQSSALEACPPGSNNCIRVTWTPPAAASKSVSIATLREALQAYPQQGQQGVDCNGWVVITDDLDGPSGKAKIEYKSCVGFFAKLVNGGKPFIDDLKLEIDDSGAVQVRSSSRVGDSDLGVNKKRVDFIGDILRAKGWNVPLASY
jgi:hypothetical protein